MMIDPLQQTRRRFLTSAGSGLGLAALASLLREDGLRAASDTGPLAPRPPHFAPRAQRCIFLFQAGGSSHVDLFDPKPGLRAFSGRPIPESLTRGVRFSFINPTTSVVMENRFPFRRYGRCGMEMSSLLPHIGACADDIALVRSMHHQAFDHAPGELMMSTGVDVPGRPSVGAWVTYGLGSEAQNLPGYVVLLHDRGPVARSMAWGNAFLPSAHAGVLFRSQGEPVLNLRNPPGVTPYIQAQELQTLQRLNQLRAAEVGDPQIAARIAAYELAFRMQAAAPQLIDVSGETRHTHALYGTDRPGEAGSYATLCLLARRLVEAGTRFVSIFQRKWDQHSKLDSELREVCHIVDQPIAALLQDLKRRGLLETTLVVWGTEFGRTPLTQNSQAGPAAGRDHHPFGYSVWMAGGGIRGGRVLGATDEFGWRAVDDPVHVNDFHATLLHLFGLDHRRLTYRHQGVDIRLTDVAGTVVSKLLES